jgi:hypothetical protein
MASDAENTKMPEMPPGTPYAPPPPDGRQSETALAVQRGVCRLLRNMGFAVLPEFVLASGRRADVIAIDPVGLIWIVEIKSSLADYRTDGKWQEYREYCDRFYFAIPHTMEHAIIPPEVGLIVADNYGAEVMRQLPDHPLHASRRKALSLQFARVAAQRLHSLWDP